MKRKTVKVHFTFRMEVEWDSRLERHCITKGGQIFDWDCNKQHPMMTLP